MRTIIVEDEPKNTKILKKFLNDFIPSIDVVGEANSIQKAKNAYFNLKPDLLLLDIQLSDGNAFDLLDEIMPVTAEIVFITAYIRMLLKPLNIAPLIIS